MFVWEAACRVCPFVWGGSVQCVSKVPLCNAPEGVSLWFAPGGRGVCWGRGGSKLFWAGREGGSVTVVIGLPERKPAIDMVWSGGKLSYGCSQFYIFATLNGKMGRKICPERFEEREKEREKKILCLVRRADKKQSTVKHLSTRSLPRF